MRGKVVVGRHTSHLQLIYGHFNLSSAAEGSAAAPASEAGPAEWRNGYNSLVDKVSGTSCSNYGICHDFQARYPWRSLVDQQKIAGKDFCTCTVHHISYRGDPHPAPPSSSRWMWRNRLQEEDRCSHHGNVKLIPGCNPGPDAMHLVQKRCPLPLVLFPAADANRSPGPGVVELVQRRCPAPLLLFPTASANRNPGSRVVDLVKKSCPPESNHFPVLPSPLTSTTPTLSSFAAPEPAARLWLHRLLRFYSNSSPVAFDVKHRDRNCTCAARPRSLGDARRKILRKEGFIIDMDGVVYHGNKLLRGVAEFVSWMQENGKKFLFLTNSSERTPQELQQKLARLGIEVESHHFYTAGQATGAFLSSQKPQGTAFVIGEPGLLNALYNAGYSVNDVSPDYVVVGETRSYNYEKIEHAVHLVLNGAKLVGTNCDKTDPSPTYPGEVIPAAGSLITPIERACGVSPYFVGKPNPLMMRSALAVLGCRRRQTIIIGDRMDTDILGDVEAAMLVDGVQEALDQEGEEEQYMKGDNDGCPHNKAASVLLDDKDEEELGGGLGASLEGGLIRDGCAGREAGACAMMAAVKRKGGDGIGAATATAKRMRQIRMDET
ncbi:hypothetical protein CBR_g50628 [Chara braunii]|uniref:Uncharacterized protein n=1 Tax=Chara braunii TaxID=69332 RepID=A0A388M770_CHABU|nr:hypothetical protein CBR_g50628 [Chara braunii]|eukprot:GBG90380.1 hypothetical protein CBR_g50628 [Chara braunii]